MSVRIYFIIRWVSKESFDCQARGDAHDGASTLKKRYQVVLRAYTILALVRRGIILIIASACRHSLWQR
jgi:hypothetical protein